MSQLVLASTSPRRKAMLAQLKVPLTVLDPDVEEPLPTELAALTDVERLAQEIALAKAKSAARSCSAEVVVLSADTIVWCRGKVLGKPADRKEAQEMLSLLSGQTHAVVTGVAAGRGGQFRTASETTRVTFLTLSPRQMETYVGSGEPFDKAGGYGIQGLGGLLVAGLEGDYSNVVGLPLSLVYRMLEPLGIDLLALGAAC